MNLTKTPYLVMFVILGAIGVTAVSAAVLVTVDELEILNGLTCPGCVGSGDIEDNSILFSDINQNSCAPNQLMKWDGANWVCVDMDDLLPATPVSCLELFNRGERNSGLYLIDPGVSPITVYCDMDTDGGGWTLVYSAPSPNEFNLAPVYDVNSPALLTSATEALVAYRDSSNIPTSPVARFDMPANWKTAHPLSYQAEDEAINVFIDGSGPTATTLRYGYFTFSTDCIGPWGGSPFGRLCFTDTNAPFYNAFASSSGDWCATSGVVFNGGPLCSPSRVFTIAVR